MGYYIETKCAKGKTEYLADRHEAEILPLRPEAFEDVPEDKALICVVDNGPFEAAALCYSREEFIEFADPNDPRPKTWLLMAKNIAHAFAGYTG